MSKIYTKLGDKGQTGLPGERRISKTDQLFEILGNLDQTSALIGLAVALMDIKKDHEIKTNLERNQSQLLTLGALLAAETKQENILQKLSEEVKWMEEEIDRMDEELPPLRNFILAGGAPAGAVLHLVRSSVRTTERQYHRQASTEKTPEIAQYLNRLSDYFFQLARYYNFLHHQPEKIWKTTSGN